MPHKANHFRYSQTRRVCCILVGWIWGRYNFRFTAYAMATTKGIKRSLRETGLLGRPALLWDSSDADERSAVYWQSQDWHSNTTTYGTPTTNTTDTRADMTLTCVTYQNLLTTAALVVVRLQQILTETAVTSPNDSMAGIPVVVAIPEGPWLPLAVLVVHALNKPFSIQHNNNAHIHAILVPLEPRDAIERSQHILNDIQPHLVLTIPGIDMERLQAWHEQYQEKSGTVSRVQVLDFPNLVRDARQILDSNKSEEVIHWLQSDYWEEAVDTTLEMITIQDVVANAVDAIQRRISSDQELVKKDMPLDSTNRISHIVYTSGTTGKPKGCVNSIQALQRYLISKNQVHSIDSSSTVLLASAVSFDPCLSDILATLQAGATLGVAPRNQWLTSMDTIVRNLEVTHVLCTPTLWSMVRCQNVATEFPSLQVVALGGEPIPSHVVQTWAVGANRSDSTQETITSTCRLLATYGVTEACVYQTAGEMIQQSRGSTSSGQLVGTPFPGVSVRICREDNSQCLIDVEEGEKGEVVLSGSQVDAISGYWGRPDLVAKFLAEKRKDESGEMVTTYHYRTGDRGVLDGGNLRILGRIVGEEGMVKVNGVRVELGEIESSIVDDSPSKIPAIIEGCLTKVVDAETMSSSRKEIHAYVVLSRMALADLGYADAESLPLPGALVTGGALQTLLRARCTRNIKAACIPSAFVVVPRFPLSPTGKKNRDGLPKLSECQSLADSKEQDGIPLQDYGTLGKFLAETIIECLNLQPLQQSMMTTGVTFDMLGGDSLAATRIIRALYAYHHQVDNTRFLGGDYGKFNGPFDVIHLLRAESLGQYIDMLTQNKIGLHATESIIQSQETKSEADAPAPDDYVNRQDSDEGKHLYSALLEATTLGQSALAQTLLHEGADPDHGNHGKRLGKVSGGFFHRKFAFYSSPMHLACMKGDDALVKLLLEKGANFKSPDASGLFPLHLAASSMNGVKSAPDEDQRRLNCVKLLLEAGSPLKMRDGNHQTVLHAAARSGHSSILEYVMILWKETGGERVDLPPAKRYVNWLDRWYRTPVHWAVLNGRVKALEILLRLGCSPTPYKPKSGKHTSVAMEYPMELCDRLYPPNTEDVAKEAIGDEIRRLLRDAMTNEWCKDR